SFRVTNRAGDLEPVANDTGILQESVDELRRESGDPRRIKISEGPAVRFALIQNGFPAQAGLCAFQRDEFEEDAVVVDWYAPFEIVIGDAQRRTRPGAAGGLACNSVHGHAG